MRFGEYWFDKEGGHSYFIKHIPKHSKISLTKIFFFS